MKPLTAIVALALTTAATAQHDDDRVDALQAEVNALRAEVAALRADSGADWLTEQRADQIRGLVQDVLADADTRASFAADGLTAGYDNGFFIGSPDGNFLLRINGQLQVRFIYSGQNDGPDDDHRWGFENTRTKLIFTGHVVDPRWIYRVEGNFNRDGGAFGLLDAYIGRALGDSGWTLLAGQFKVPMLREELVLDPYQQAIERSLVNQEFTAARTQGIAADYRNDVLHVTLGYTDGHPASGGFNRPALVRDTEYSLTGRAELLLAGEWAQFNQHTSWPDAEPGLLLGGAVHYQDGEYGTTDDELEVFQWTADISAHFGGANIFAYVVGRQLDSMTLDRDQLAAVVQAGVFVTDDWELFGRYEWGDDDSGGEDLSVLTIGANRYFARHALKWSIDAGYAFNEVTSTFGDGQLGTGGDITGWRTDTADEDGQVVVRTQMQLLF